MSGQHRGGTHAVEIVERPKRDAPTLVAVRSVGNEAEVAEEHVHIGTVGHRRGGRRAIQLVQLLFARLRERASPERAARAVLHDNRMTLVFVQCGVYISIAGEEW